MKKKAKFYTVWIGRKPGVYSNWEECKAQILGFENAVYKSFPTLVQAEKAFADDSQNYIGKENLEPGLSKEELVLIGRPIEDSICVDGAWNTKTNVIEYQGVLFSSRKRIFHAGPFDIGTNNIAEFLAIVHALSYCKIHSLSSAIYSDSRTAIAWIKRKKAATKIDHIDSTKYILSVIHRAESWLENNVYDNKILKWETAAWGENPADFGRK